MQAMILLLPKLLYYVGKYLFLRFLVLPFLTIKTHYKTVKLCVKLSIPTLFFLIFAVVFYSQSFTSSPLQRWSTGSD